jgi:hypothetical protein
LAVVASALADLELKKMEARERQTIAEYDAELAASEELERVGRLREQAEQVFAETYDRVFAVEPEDVPDQPDHAQPDAGEGGGQ